MVSLDSGIHGDEGHGQESIGDRGALVGADMYQIRRG